MTLLDERPEVIDGPQEAQALFEEARRLRRRRWAVAGVVAAAIALGVVAWWMSTGTAHGQPPATPRPPVRLPVRPAIPAGATPIQTRSVDGWTIRIFASPSGLPIAKVDAEWKLFDPHGSLEGTGSSTVGPALLSQPGVANLGGGSSDGFDGWQAIRNYQVTLPTIASVRVVDGTKVLDSMSPVTFDGVRFVVLAVINVPSLQPLILQGLDASGKIVSWSAFQLPSHPLTQPGQIHGSGSGSFNTDSATSLS